MATVISLSNRTQPASANKPPASAAGVMTLFSSGTWDGEAAVCRCEF